MTSTLTWDRWVRSVGPNHELWYRFVSWCGEETVRMEVPSKQKTLFQTYPIPTNLMDPQNLL